MGNTRALGNNFEDLACQYLWCLGYQIMERNYYTRYGEIDIVAEKDNVVVFCEVRGLLESNYQKTAEELLPYRKLSRFRRNAQYWLDRNEIFDVDAQLDFIGIIGKNNFFEVTHVQNT